MIVIYMDGIRKWSSTFAYGSQIYFLLIVFGSEFV